MNKLCLITALFLYALTCSYGCTNGAKNDPKEEVLPDPIPKVSIPLAGNAYITKSAAGQSEKISSKGLVNWTTPGVVTSIWFRSAQQGELTVFLKAGIAGGGTSKVKVRVNGASFEVSLAGADAKTYYAGKVNIAAEGYVKVDLEGISKSGSSFADVSDIQIGGVAANGAIYANDPENFYWSRRGPSTHVNYTIPAGDIEYFYNELVVPEKQDQIGSFFMCNGFSHGYFGVQVKSESERWVLFSVWDPEGGTTVPVKSGEGVVTKRFGGEGEGGQSYFVYNWKAGNTYKFLTKGKPDGNGNTLYSAWFRGPEHDKWRFMATWKRPLTTTYLAGIHSFLENFIPEQGYLERKGTWGNQWVRDANGKWTEVTAFKMGVDATGKNKQRMDFGGGVENGRFFLRNGGFFNTYVEAGTPFTRPAGGQLPQVDIESLP